MTSTFGPVAHRTQAFTLVVVLALTAFLVAVSEPDGRAASPGPAPSLAALASAQPAAPLDVRVRMRASVDRSRAVRAVRQAGGIPLGAVAGDMRVRISAAAAVALSRRPDVLGVSVLTR